METIKLNRNLVKILYKLGEDIDTYRYYTIARRHFDGRSGVFSLAEFCDVLHKHYEYKSLHRKPGNRRKRFKHRLYRLFMNSPFFRPAPGDSFVLNSDRKVLYKYFGNTKSTWYEADAEILKSKKLFTDFCIGTLLAGNRFRANKNIAKYCGYTHRRIQQATSRNHQDCTFRKQFNFIEVETGSYKNIERTRAELYNVHGISSPKPYRYKGEWVLRLNAPNSYRTFVSCGVKGYMQRPPKTFSQKECWFKPVKARFRNLALSKQLKLYGEDFKRWVFNERVYDFNQYMREHSVLFS